MYIIESEIRHPDALVNISDQNGRIVNFFINDIGSKKFLEHTKIQVQSEEGYNKDNILKTDFFGSALGIPVFSTNAKEVLETKLKDEIVFYECDLLFKGGDIKCFLGKIIKSLTIISEEKSRFRISSTGSKFLIKPIVKQDIKEEFFIAKDIEYPTYFYVSEKFKKIIEDSFLKMNFKLMERSD